MVSVVVVVVVVVVFVVVVVDDDDVVGDVVVDNDDDGVMLLMLLLLMMMMMMMLILTVLLGCGLSERQWEEFCACWSEADPELNWKIQYPDALYELMQGLEQVHTVNNDTVSIRQHLIVCVYLQPMGFGESYVASEDELRILVDTLELVVEGDVMDQQVAFQEVALKLGQRVVAFYTRQRLLEAGSSQVQQQPQQQQQQLHYSQHATTTTMIATTTAPPTTTTAT